MKTTHHQNITKSSALLLVLLLTAVGCGTTKPKPPKPVQWNVSLTKVSPASIEADLVGVTSLDKPYWQNINVSDYFRKNSSIRNGARKVTTTFKDGPTWVLKKEDAIWTTWFSYGATELMVIADLPGKYSPGPSDGRRTFLSLDKKAWLAPDETIKVEIQDERIQVLTPQKP
jgi:hypothetical protein